MERTSIISGRLVLVVLTASILLWAAMVFGTLAHVRKLASGLDPFDMRPLGYGTAEARVLLDALGEAGRDFYARVQLRLDAVFPATYAISRGLLLWWLTMDGRLRAAPIPVVMRIALIALPVAAAGFDYAENFQICRMLAAGPNIEARVIETASRMTLYKSLASSVTEISVIGFAIAAGMRWRRRQP